MHLLAATPGSVDDGKEPVDLSQTPSDVIFISAADTELAALSTARSEMSDPPGLRLACIWLAPGLHMACVKPASGLRLACIWPASGLHLACVRPASGLRPAFALLA